VCRWAGTGKLGYNNTDPGAHRLDSRLYFPQDVTFGPDGRGYIVDFNNHRIRRAELDGSLVDIMGSDYEGDGPPQMEDRLPLCAATGAPGTTVALNHPTDATFGPDGKLYVAAWHNNKIRVYDPATDLVTAIGDGYGYAGEGAAACHALFNQPKAVEIAPDGTIYTIDQRNVRIRKIAMTAGTAIEDAIVTTIAGRGVPGDAGDGGDAMLAEFGFETGTTPRTTGALVLDGRLLYVADSVNNRIRRIDLDTGIIDCIAGLSSEAGYAGDGGPALDAKLDFPTDMEMGPDHRLYVADTNNNVVRAIDLETHTIETVVGSGATCDTSKETCPDVSAIDAAAFNEPYGIAFDNDGVLYVADTHNHRIMKVAR
jgi:sugar lactone lactonase YvrE